MNVFSSGKLDKIQTKFPKIRMKFALSKPLPEHRRKQPEKMFTDIYSLRNKNDPLEKAQRIAANILHTACVVTP